MKSPKVTVIDYGVGNLLSVRRGLEHCGATVNLTANADEILAADRVVLPGVGAFGNAMEALKNLELLPVIEELSKNGTPFLGICLGMQLMLEESEEFGITKGLGLISGRVIPVPNQTISGKMQKIPHIGWNKLEISSSLTDWKNSLLQDVSPGESTYFVHSYMAVPNNQANRIADCLYGGREIAAVIGKDNVTGCQFHPEKSGEVGLKVLRRFIKQ
jgi:imidazole glycerol-phosphate synthase subunit HisH